MKLQLVEGWKHLWKSWAVQMAALGATLPELLQLLADHTDLVPWLDDGYKSGIRLGCLLLIPVLRTVKQPSIPPKEAP